MTDIIMCANVFDKKLPDDQYQTEFEAASKVTKVHLFDIFKTDTFKLPKAEQPTKLIYHGWMMPPAYYSIFYERCKSFGYELINNPDQYKACHHFPGWYPALKGLTPLSMIVEINDLRPMVDEVVQFMQRNKCAVILKDYVKSLKHDWYDACFIPKDADFLRVTKVLANFMALKKDMNDLQGNLVVREFHELEMAGTHDKSGMPLAKEFRTWVLNGKLLPTYKYWQQGSYSLSDFPQNIYIQILADNVYRHTKSNLFTVDVAKTKSGNWTCIEVGDGQVSALPDHEDREEFFRRLVND